MYVTVDFICIRLVELPVTRSNLELQNEKSLSVLEWEVGFYLWYLTENSFIKEHYYTGN